MMKVTIDGIEVEVTKKKIKNLNLRIKPPQGTAHLSVPWGVSDEYIYNFLNSKLVWMKDHINNIKESDIKESKYTNGEEHLVFGEKYKLIILIKNEKQRIYIEDDKLIMILRDYKTLEYRKKLLDEFYRELLMKEIPRFVDIYENKMGVKVLEFRTKKMTTRWGTCNNREKRIWINLEFGKLDLKFLEYIVVHEMVHLLEKGHNERFYGYMNCFLPNWKDLKKELNKNYL